MKPEPQKPDAPTDALPRPDEEVACEKCGRFGAVQVGDHFLCVDCYEGFGSCCQESTMNDPDAGCSAG